MKLTFRIKEYFAGKMLIGEPITMTLEDFTKLMVDQQVFTADKFPNINALGQYETNLRNTWLLVDKLEYQ